MKPVVGAQYLVSGGSNFRGLVGQCMEVRKTPGCYRVLLDFGRVQHWLEDYRIEPKKETLQ